MSTTLRSLRALSDPTRLRIVNLLSRGSLFVCDIQRILEQPQSSVSRHLALLKSAGLIRDRMNETLYLSGEGIRAKLSASFGIGTFPTHAHDVTGLLAAADRSLFDSLAIAPIRASMRPRRSARRRRVRFITSRMMSAASSSVIRRAERISPR